MTSFSVTCHHARPHLNHKSAESAPENDLGRKQPYALGTNRRGNIHGSRAAAGGGNRSEGSRRSRGVEVGKIGVIECVEGFRLELALNAPFVRT
jgi:hypothetical protein